MRGGGLGVAALRRLMVERRVMGCWSGDERREIGVGCDEKALCAHSCFDGSGDSKVLLMYY